MKPGYLIIATLFVLSSCYLDVSPRQSSKDIAEAKKNKVFAKEYRVVQEPRLLLPTTEVWAEHIQFVNGGFFSKKITIDPALEIVLNTDSTQQSIVKPSKVVFEYELFDSVSYSYVGTADRLYFSPSGGDVMDTICFNVTRKEDQKMLGRIWLYKK